MDDSTTPIWVRITGAAVILAIVAASVLIVGRNSRPSSAPEPAPSAPAEDEPVEPAPAESTNDVMDSFSPEELSTLRTCIAEDATLATKPSGPRLRRIIGLRESPLRLKAAYGDLAEIAADVEALRGLRYEEPITTRFLSSKKIGKLAASPVSSRSWPTMRFEEIALRALGVLPRTGNLRDIYSELVTDQVAGFYRPRVNQLVVPTPGPGEPLAPLDKAVVAHELEHALVDQGVGFPGDLHQVRDPDGSLAALAVVEGSATLTGYRWAQSGLNFFEVLRLSGDPRASESEELSAAVPAYVMQQFTFPYLEGVLFVCHLYETGGWKRVNRALRKPPSTTLEILNPELYLDGYEAPKVSRPASPGPGWTHSFGTTFGAADWTGLLRAPGNDPEVGLEDAEELAGQWAGGRLHVWTKRNRATAAVIGRSTGEDLCRSVLHWYDFSFDDDVLTVLAPGLRADWLGEEQSASVSCPRNEIRLGISSSMDAARRIVRGR